MSKIFPSVDSDQLIFVLQIRLPPKPGAVRAYVDIRYGAATIWGLTVVEYNGGLFVGFPSNLGKNGKRFPIVDFAEPERSEISKIVLAAFKERI